MRNTTILLAIAVLVVLAGSFIFTSGDEGITGNVIAQDPQVLQGETQRVVLGVKDFNYFPNTIKVKANKPVEIVADKSLMKAGCLRGIISRDLGISKTFTKEGDSVTFTPSKKGIFTFACPMNMGFGKIEVV